MYQRPDQIENLTLNELRFVDQFYHALAYRAKIVADEQADNESIPEEDQFLDRMDRKLMVNVEVYYPKEWEGQDVLAHVKRVLHTYVIGTDCDTQEYHDYIEDMSVNELLVKE